jgi:hypothetical protein
MMKQENESEIEMFLEEADGQDGGARNVQDQLIPGTSTGNSDAAAKKRSVKSLPGGSSSPRGGEEAKDTVAKRKLRKKKAEESSTAVLIKYAALFLLVTQMVGLVLLMRYSRTSQSANEPLYLASTAVFIMEVMKLIICCGVIAVQSGGTLLSELNTHVLHSPMELLKLCVPSLLYTVQNNLLYLALTNLDAATYQVCYQLKILTTALFSAILLQVGSSPPHVTELRISQFPFNPCGEKDSELVISFILSCLCWSSYAVVVVVILHSSLL